MNGKQMFRILLMSGSFVALLSGLAIACIFSKPEYFMGTLGIIVAGLFFSYVGEVWN